MTEEVTHKQVPNFPAPTPCPCLACLTAAGKKVWWMVVCDECGNKRCPHGTDHSLVCTGSNKSGQKGSRY